MGITKSNLKNVIVDMGIVKFKASKTREGNSLAIEGGGDDPVAIAALAAGFPPYGIPESQAPPMGRWGGIEIPFGPHSMSGFRVKLSKEAREVYQWWHVKRQGWWHWTSPRGLGKMPHTKFPLLDPEEFPLHPNA